MNTSNAQPGIWSIRCYRWLLWLYPSGFVSELGDSVEQAFRDMLRDAFQKRGYLGIAQLWFRIVPDFVFSAFELLTSTAGDYLKWYFRLRWVLACALGFGTGSMVVMALRAAGFFEHFGLNPRWGLAGLPLWLGLGFFQSHVLTSRFCHRLRWVCFTAFGGVIGILGARLISSAFATSGLGPLLPGRWDTWALFPIVSFFPALAGGTIGLLQWYAFRKRDVQRFHWFIVCGSGVFFSGLLSFPVSLAIGFAARIGLEEIMANLLQNAAAGALFGLITAGPLKRILWNQPAEPGAAAEPFTGDKEVS